MNNPCHNKVTISMTLLASCVPGIVANMGSASKLQRVMKLTAVLLTACCLQVSARSGAQVSFSGKDVRLDVVFQAIGKQTGYIFLYSPDDLKDTKPVTIDVKNVSIETIMKKCLEGQPLEFTIADKTVFVKRIKLKNTQPDNFQMAIADPIDVRGRVINEEGDPVISATITIKNTTISTLTDDAGEFVLREIPSSSTIIISAVNIETVTYIVRTSEKILIRAKTQVNPLEEVIYKGYYYEKRNQSVSSTVKIKGSEIARQPVENPLLALQGRVPGLVVSQTNGVSGGTLKVQIRGQNSLANGSDPLYVIDDVPINSQLPPGIGNILGQASSNYDNRFQSFGNPLSFINPADIESIEVLKDADATAIYGSRAANGAILITTKKGKAGKAKFDLTAQTGIGTVTRRLDLLNLRQYLDMRYEALRNDNISIDPNVHFDLAVWDTTRQTDWQKEMLGKNAQNHDLQASISGGNDKVQYLIGTGLHKEYSVLPGNYANQKASIHFNLSTTADEGRFKAKLSGNYLYGDNKLPQEDPTRYIYLAPNAPKIYNTDGTLNWEPSGTIKSTWDHPLAYTKRRFRNQTTNLVANANLSYSLFDFLEIKTSLGYNAMNVEEISSVPFESLDPKFAEVSTSRFNNGLVKSWVIEPQLSFIRDFGKHRIDALVGTTWQSSNSNSKIIKASGFSSNALLENPQAADDVSIILGNQSMYKYNALYSRIHYSFDERYILNLTGRRDGSSRFGPGNRFHNFGAIGAGWVFTNEKWLENLDFLSFGKIRANWGTTGSDQIGDYRYLNLYYSTVYAYQGSGGLFTNNLFNPILAWEETRKFEIGGEIGILNDRIFLTANYYDNKSGNQLGGYRLASTTGFGTIDANQDAVIKNWGWEFSLNSTNIKTSKIVWTTTFNISKVGNKIQSLGENFFGDKGRSGKSINAILVYGYAGVDSESGEYRFLDKSGKPTNSPDTMFWMDLTPSFYGGIQNTISYKRFQLDFFLQFVKQRGQETFFGMSPGNGGDRPNQPSGVLNRWSPSNKDGSIQRYNADGSIAYLYDMAAKSDFAYGNASFIRLKNISLYYQFDPNLIKSFRHIKLFLQAQNLLTLTNYNGLDPETRGFTTLPPLRVITVGVQFSL